MVNFSFLPWGTPAPWFQAPTATNPRFNFASLGGRFILLAFVKDGQSPKAKAFVDALVEADVKETPPDLLFFAVSQEAADMEDATLARVFARGRVFHDPDLMIAKAYGLTNKVEDGIDFASAWYLLDPTLRVYRKGLLRETDKLKNVLQTLPKAGDHAMTGQESWAPVLMVPRVLTPDFCAHLIDVYRQGQPNQSGFMREFDGRTVPILDTNFKRRSDIQITDPAARQTLKDAIAHRLRPEVEKAFQFHPTRIERYIVARYGAEDQGFFQRHRDNTTSGTAHRRFAVSINLNAEDHEGGELRFPEFGTRTYKPPTGGAVVFSCSLLHEATPVTKGERFATLPFLYDDAAAAIRQQNRDKIDSETLVVSG